MKTTLQCPCGETARSVALSYEAPPAGETIFPMSGSYQRRYEACRICGHFFGVHNIDLSGIYESAYVDATYRSADGLANAFKRITSLPPEKSDNAARALRVDHFAKVRGAPSAPSLLDIGSGLGVFPFAMKGLGWNVTALDPDPRAAEHIRKTIEIPVVCGDFRKVEASKLGCFNAISFNKVLEHVEDPVALLARAVPLLAPHGFVYIEVPDVTAACEGPGREEFFIDHYHVFSAASLIRMIEAAALQTLKVERIREPSTKFTLFAFAGHGSDA